MEAGPKLDALIAEKVMGLNVEWRGGQPMWVGKDLPGMPYVLGDGLYGHTIRPYSTDIAEAWKVILKLSQYAPAVFKCGGMVWLGEGQRPEGGEWGCRLDLAEDRKENYVVGYGETAAEAICRAALKAMEIAKLTK